MHETMITVTGNLCADPELRFTQGGDAFAAFRIACTERKRNREGGWGDGHTNFVRVPRRSPCSQSVTRRRPRTMTRVPCLSVAAQFWPSDWKAVTRTKLV